MLRFRSEYPSRGNTPIGRILEKRDIQIRTANIYNIFSYNTYEITTYFITAKLRHPKQAIV
jgi:chorismate-pyruvate lyase